ncbi:sugar ABC transporter substrate-binding protein [Acuticoccus sp. M5D2P5]|uniref:ABC transporter substrate-binding protein n=1 Tax=Acuticoccus kalidii TaxID=2910977 RepID=UPI001F47D6B2|nr:sugar ABC transporter substrate-binding protein [Acuticoccus kalidii]MCF3934042.1 sugar ABC transporter substrate-binding protein [Acuticoccus kalidii]
MTGMVQSNRSFGRGWRSGAAFKAALFAGVAMASVAAHSSVAAAQDKTTIEFAASVLADPSRGPIYQKWIDGFNEAHDDIEVKAVGIPFSSFANTVLTQLGGGQGPDVMRLDLDVFMPAASAGLLMDLDDTIADGEYDFIGPDQYMKLDGTRYGVVFSMTPYVLLYNADLAKGVPETFEELIEDAKAARTDSVYGYAFRTTMNQAAGFWQDLCNFVYGFGGEWADAEGNLTINSPEVVAGVAAYKEMYDAGVIPVGATSSEYRQMFWEGKVAYMIDNGGVAGLLANKAPDLPLEAVPSPFPHPEQGMVLAALAVNANSKNKDAATEFVKWVLSPEAQQALLTIPGEVYAGTKVARPEGDTETAKTFEKVMEVYTSQADYGTPQLVPGYADETPQMQQIILEEVVRVLKSGDDPQEAMDRAQSQIERRVLRR